MGDRRRDREGGLGEGYAGMGKMMEEMRKEPAYSLYSCMSTFVRITPCFLSSIALRMHAPLFP